ncbi:conserved hypothetical protein [Trichinella spiralis]|uniref:hypothetical protein n=1 Tax=Trichinella spiralis TaxID=6334 RepID=UPI0001EFD73E|nr:conserved hypothetical protein [Trichinella spiralis]
MDGSHKYIFSTLHDVITLGITRKQGLKAKNCLRHANIWLLCWEKCVGSQNNAAHLFCDLIDIVAAYSYFAFLFGLLNIYSALAPLLTDQLDTCDDEDEI